MPAKPIIDILVETPDLAAIDQRAPAMIALGYQAMGEFGIGGRRYFRKFDSRGRRTHHVHAFLAGSAAVARHLAFRDFLIAHPAEAQAYAKLKLRLAAAHANDWESYHAGKDSLIKTLEAAALRWHRP